VRFGNLTGGRCQGGDEALANINPWDSDVMGECALAGAPEAQLPRGGGRRPTAWSSLPGYERFAILDRAGSEILDRVDKLGSLLAPRAGKDSTEARGRSRACETNAALCALRRSQTVLHDPQPPVHDSQARDALPRPKFRDLGWMTVV
jgi:acyl-CoA reductase-like NAD-dependent aldehyde dehydrogenase